MSIASEGSRSSPVAARALHPPGLRGESLRVLGWFGVAILARLPLLGRIEGILDHDQSIVGLMALDIASGRRWPIYFDGQRYMGALESYVAAGFVRVLGHSPGVVACSPLLFFGLFVAGQYACWSRWSGRTTGHLAASITVFGAPLPTLWGLVPRGGYVELLAWSMPVLATYRRVIRPDAPALDRPCQFAWGFLLALGYFLNPLALVVYLTLGLDWTFGRHGADLREARRLGGGWRDAPLAPVVWGVLAGTWLLAVAACVHVSFSKGQDTSPFVFLLDQLPPRWGMPLGVLGMIGLLGGGLWWSGAAGRIAERLAEHPAFAFGALLGLGPMVAHAVLVRLGWLPWDPSLPIWIRAPWAIGPNLRDGLRALGPLIGCTPDATTSVLLGQGVALPEPAWPLVVRGLAWVSPVLVAAVLGLIALVAWRDRLAWRRFGSLRGQEPTPPTVLATLGLGVMAGLYLLQATSLNASSIRYLLPTWIFVPGLLAVALRTAPRPVRWPAGLVLLLGWTTAQGNLWADLDRPSPLQPLARSLERHGVTGIVAPTPVALMVANLTSGRVGAVEYQPPWPRLRARYAGRFAAGRPVVCVVDRQFPWAVEGVVCWSPRQDLGRALRELDSSHPGRVRRAWEVGRFEVWEVDLPLAEIVAHEPSLLPSGEGSAMVSENSR